MAEGRQGGGLQEGARIAIVGAGPAGSLLAIALLDAARVRRKKVAVSLYDGGSSTAEPSAILVDARALERLGRMGASITTPNLVGEQQLVRTVAEGVEAGATTRLRSIGSSGIARGDVRAALRAAALSRGARLLRRPVEGLREAGDGVIVVRAGGASDLADVVVLACGAGAPLTARIEAHVPPPLWRCCSASLTFGARARSRLSPRTTHLLGRAGLPDLWIVPEQDRAYVLAVGRDVSTGAFTEALMSAVALGRLPDRLHVHAVHRRLLAMGAARPALPTIGGALGGNPYEPQLGHVAEVAGHFAAALLDGGAPAMIDACRVEALAIARVARARERSRRFLRRLPRGAIAQALQREQISRADRRPIEKALAALADPARTAREARSLFRRLPAIFSLFVALVSLFWNRLRGVHRARPTRPSRAEVFVVEDDPEQTALLCTYLLAHGIACRSFTNGIVAAAAAAREAPAALLIDVCLPHLDGPGVCLALRRNPATADVPVFLVTALPLSLARSEAARVGATEVFAKPLDLQVLRRRLRSIVPPRAPRKPARPSAMGTKRFLTSS